MILNPQGRNGSHLLRFWISRLPLISLEELYAYIAQTPYKITMSDLYDGELHHRCDNCKEWHYDDHEKAHCLDNLAASLILQFHKTGDVADASRAISAAQQSLDLTPNDDANLIDRLNRLAHILRAKRERFGGTDDIKEEVRVQERLVDLVPDAHADKPLMLMNLGGSLTRQFEQSRDIKDIDRAIRVQEYALNLVRDGLTDRPLVLESLGNSLLHRFEHLGRFADVNEAIVVRRQAIASISDSSTNKPSMLMGLGRSLMRRFERSREMADINESIAVGQQAIDLASDNQADKPLMLTGLGSSLARRFERSGDIADINKAVHVHQQAIDLAGDGPANKPVLLMNLGVSLGHRFDRLGETVDIDKAISVLRQALDLTLDGHVQKHNILINLGRLLARRFGRSGEIDDINKAVSAYQQALDVIPNDHADRKIALMNLSTSLSRRFKRSADKADIDRAIIVGQQATDTTPEEHAGKHLMLMNLGNTILCRFERFGSVGDVDKAIYIQQLALTLTRDGDPVKLMILTNLGGSLMHRFERLGEMADIDKAIFVRQQAVDLTPDGHVNMPTRLANLGLSLMHRFQRSWNIVDIDRAIRVQQQAIELTPEGHAEMLLMLVNLGRSLTCRFEQSGEMADVDESIRVQRQALGLTPDNHADKPSTLMYLGISLAHRFDRFEDAKDIDEAIRVQQQALNLTPNGHFDKPLVFKSLGTSYELRFRIFHQSDDAISALSAFEESCRSVPGSPSILFQAAQSWARLSAQYAKDVVSSLDAYYVMVSLIPRFAWLGNTVHQRLHDIRTISAAVTEAAAFACSCGRLDLALEWLEQGRSIVWTQTLNIRTPMGNLEHDHPGLYRELKFISQQLNSSTNPSQLPINAIASRESLSLEEAAQNHRRLTEKWEALLTEVRSRRGYGNFLRPRELSNLISASIHATIVVINNHPDCCDAFILRQASPAIEHMHLSLVSKDLIDSACALFLAIIGRRGNHNPLLMDVKDMSNMDTSAISSRLLSELDSTRGTSIYDGSTPPRRLMKMEIVLAFLWEKIVKPVLDFLGFFKPAAPEKLPRIVWCATGSLALLPLHAAGLYFDGDQYTQKKLYNYAVSSYTPTLSALLHASEKKSDKFCGLLAVSQPATPNLNQLPGTVDEVMKIQRLMEKHQCRFDWLNHDQATVINVLKDLEHYSWIHLACHGRQRQDEAIESALALYDGHLTLQRISHLTLDSARFAFLSACQTATGVDNSPDEAIHLGAGMLIAGYQSVIATLWSISDLYAPKVAENVYKELLKDTETKNGQAAYALHRAIEYLRNDPAVGEKDFISWVPFIHLGL